MKNGILLIFITAVLQLCVNAQNIGIGTSIPDASAMLDVNSTTRGMLVPRMTTAQRTAIAAPVHGLLVFDITTNTFWFYNGTVWTELTTGGSTGWTLTGNGGIADGTHFIGTTTNVPLSFRQNNISIGRLDAGKNNVFLGDLAGGGVETANNTMIGDHAGYSQIGIGIGHNTFIGSQAGYSNTNATENTYIGSNAGYSNTITSGNTMIGYNAGYNNTAGSNTFIGHKTGAINTTGTDNVFVGKDAGYNNTTASGNTFIGKSAGKLNNVGLWNTATGSNTLYFTIGSGNSAFGYNTLLNNAEGLANTANGVQALYSNTTADRNVAVGYHALHDNTTASNNTATGYLSLNSNTIGTVNTGYGYHTLSSNTTGSANTGAGYDALLVNTTGNGNTAIGSLSLGSNINGEYNTGFGAKTLATNAAGINNTAIGTNALYSNNFGNDNTAIGVFALENNTNIYGNHNTAIGSYTLQSNTTGFFNTATGYKALLTLNSTNSSTAYGCWALQFNTRGDNTAMGVSALEDNQTGENNTAVGRLAYALGTAYSNSTAIGYNTSITSSFQIRLGNSFITSIGGQTGWSTLSDGRFKKDITENIPGLSFIMKLRPVSYHVNTEAFNSFLKIPDSIAVRESMDLVQTGFLAQEVEQAARGINFDFSGIDKPKNENDYYSLRYAEFVVPMIKAIQEQRQYIQKLEKESTELEATLLQLRKEMSALQRIEKEKQVSSFAQHPAEK